MAIETPVKEVSLELIRELLIAISQSTPEQLIAEGLNGAMVNNKDKPEELRPEMISMSSITSPEDIKLPSTGVQEA